MKKFTLILAIVLTGTFFCQGQIDTLIYDNDTYTGFINQGQHGVRMSPSGPCEVLSVKYFLTKGGVSSAAFIVNLYNWEGTQPALDPAYQKVEALLQTSFTGWYDINLLLSDSVVFEGDFVVSWTFFEPIIELAYDADLQTGRNWTFDNGVWSEVTDHSFLIRVTVKYTTTGEIEELEGTPISVYPNPATDVLTIEASNNMQNVMLINPTGQVVRSIKLEAGKTSIDLNGLGTGVYFVRIETQKGTTTKKVVIQ